VWNCRQVGECGNCPLTKVWFDLEGLLPSAEWSQPLNTDG
jgi:hypothetical protein